MDYCRKGLSTVVAFANPWRNSALVLLARQCIHVVCFCGRPTLRFDFLSHDRASLCLVCLDSVFCFFCFFRCCMCVCFFLLCQVVVYHHRSRVLRGLRDLLLLALSRRHARGWLAGREQVPTTFTSGHTTSTRSKATATSVQSVCCPRAHNGSLRYLAKNVGTVSVKSVFRSYLNI